MRTVYPHPDKMKSPLFIVFALFGAAFLFLSLSLTLVAESAKLGRYAYSRLVGLPPVQATALVAGSIVTVTAQYYWMSI